MQTDIPLKRLTALRGADLLLLLGLPYATLVSVETIELPASATRLDIVLRVRTPGGQEYLHVVEWQGYFDPAVLWRLVGYLAWLGQRTPDIPIIGTVVYLKPGDDVGDTLTQVIDGKTVQEWKVRCVRLWKQDAPQALTSGNLGLTVLSPLMQNADSNLVEQAVQVVLNQATPDQQADLLSILGVFAEPLMQPDRFVRLVGKEKLMASDLFTYLMEEKMAEIQPRIDQLTAEKDRLAAEKDRLAAEKDQIETENARIAVEKDRISANNIVLHTQFQQALEDAIIARFPQAPITLLRDMRGITRPEQLHTLIVAVVQAADLSDFERALKEAVSGE